MKKRFWALFLAVMMIVSVLPTTAFAEDAAGSAEMEPGKIRATKSLVLDEAGEPVVDKDGYYTIQLAVQGAPVKTDKAVDVILCIDVSNSMTGEDDDQDGYVVKPGEACGGRIQEQGEWVWIRTGRFTGYYDWVETGWKCGRCGETWDMSDDDPGNWHNVKTAGVTRLDIAKDAAEHFTTELLGTDLDIRMAVVAFGGKNGGLNDQYLASTDLTNDSDTIVSFVEDLQTPEQTRDNSDGGTNYTSALGKAIDLFKNSTGRDKFVLFLSDGEPAYTSDQSNNTSWNGINQANDLKNDGVTIYSGGIAIDDSDSAPLKAIASTKNGNVLYQAISKDNMAADLKNLMNIVKEDAFIAAGREAVMVDVVNTNAFILDVDTSATVKEEDGEVTWKIGDITSEIQTLEIKVKPKDNVYGKAIATNENCVLTYIDPEGTKREIECESPTVDIPAPVSYVIDIDGEGPDVDEDELPETESYVEGVSVPVEDDLDDVETEDGTWVFQGWTTDDAVVADGVFIMPAAPVVFVGTWKFTPATTDPSVIEPVGAVYETEYYFEESVGGDYAINAELTTRTPELLGKEVTGKELTDVPAGYVYDPVETGDKNKATVKLPEYIYGQDSEDPIGIKLTTVQLYYSLDANNDRIPDKYQTTVTFKVVNGSWNDETADDKTIVVTLTDEKGVWAEDGSYTLTADDVPAVGAKPADNFKAGAWDKTPAGEEITKEITFTYTYVREIEVVEPVGAVYETEYYFEESVGGDYAINAELTTRTPELLGTEVTGEELAEDKIPENYVFDPVETGNKNKGTVAMPTPIRGEDGETVVGVNLTTLEMYYSLDENGDDIPDKYQTIVTFEVVNGSWDDESTAAKEIVVTLTDEDGVWAEEGSYTLTADDVPAVGAKPADNFKAGAWDKTPAGEEITKETTFTYTYVREIEVIEPVAAVYKVEHYKQNADGTWPTEPTEIEFPLIGKIGDTVTATAKDYGKFYSVNEALSVLSGEVFKPFVVEGANEPSYLVLKVYYDKLEPSVSITKVADDTSVYVGEKVTYTIIVTNTGNVALTDLVVKDVFTQGGNGETVWTIASLAPGASQKIEFSYRTSNHDVGGLKNIAVVTGKGPDGGEVTDITQSVETDVYREHIVRPTRPALNKEDHYAYIVGYPDGLVHPERNITRAEVSTIFFRMLLDESREDFWAQENWFSDVPADQWYNNAVSTLSNAGLITGYPDGSFKPNANITRAEFATIAIRFFLEEDVEITENNLTDVKGHWAEANINLAYALNLITGYPDNTFRPDQKITRAEAMTIVNRVLERAPHKDHLLDDMIEWPDNMDTDAWYYADVQEATNSHEFYKTEIKGEDEEYEIWTELLPVRDWAALERMWSEANSSKNPGEVVDINISTPEASN